MPNQRGRIPQQSELGTGGITKVFTMHVYYFCSYETSFLKIPLSGNCGGIEVEVVETGLVWKAARAFTDNIFIYNNLEFNLWQCI